MLDKYAVSINIFHRLPSMPNNESKKYLLVQISKCARAVWLNFKLNITT